MARAASTVFITARFQKLRGRFCHHSGEHHLDCVVRDSLRLNSPQRTSTSKFCNSSGVPERDCGEYCSENERITVYITVY